MMHFLCSHKHPGRHFLYVNEAMTHSWCCLFAWWLLFHSFVSCPKEYLEATEPRTDASPFPLSTNIFLSSSRVKNWKYLDCHCGTHWWEHAHSTSMSVLIITPPSVRLRRAPNEIRPWDFLTTHFLDEDSKKNWKRHSLNLFLWQL